MSQALDEQDRGGLIEPVVTPVRADRERTFSRIDSYPYRHRVAEIMRAPLQVAAADTPLRDALARLMRDGLSSLYVRPVGANERRLRPDDVGIVTERDLLRAIDAQGGTVLDQPVERFMSKPIATVPADAFVYRAIGRMSRLKIRHLGATDEEGFVIGSISARDLLRLRAGEAVSLGDEIDQADDVPALAAAWAKLPGVAAALMAERVSARNIASVISRELGALTRQAAVIAERRLRETGQGEPPCPYAVAVLGSGGRGESLLAMDQDNALFFAEGGPDGPEDRWFAALATQMNDILHEVGLPYCKGGVMAKNAVWRGSARTWRERIAGWIARSRPEDLLSVDIFFDLRGVCGDTALANGLRAHAFDRAKGEMAFIKLLVEAAGTVELGLNFFGGFRTDKGRIDLKKAGLFGIVTAARALAIRYHIMPRATPERLAAVSGLGIGGEHDLQGLVDATGVFLDLTLAQQLDDLQHGLPASNAVLIKRLSAYERQRLRGALEQVAQLDWLTRDLLFTAP
jgi:DNA polymerase-3 subunit epsilon/CBS domain-containing protein